MALQLSKKLAQVLGAAASTGGGNVGSPVNNNNVSEALSPNEIFNISKAKKIELQNLSSILSAGSTPSSPSMPEVTLINASSDGKPQTVTGTPHPAETQSTVIISFKSSQTPAQSQPSNAGGATFEATNTTTSSSTATSGLANVSAAASTASFADEAREAEEAEEDDAPNQKEENLLDSTLPPLTSNAETSSIALTKETSATPATPVAVAATSTATATAATTTANSSPCPGTPTNRNVLKRVASYIVTPSSATNNGNNGMHMENINRRSSYVPEKLSFDAYEKFEGQMLVKWLISSLQLSNCNLNEMDLTLLVTSFSNNLMKIGVLKQISDKSENDTFNPYQMYQWAYSDQQMILGVNNPATPGKLEKLPLWLASSTPLPATRTGDGLPDIVEVAKRLLACTTIEEVRFILTEIIDKGDKSPDDKKCPKRFMGIPELLDASEATIYEYDKLKETLCTKEVQTDQIKICGPDCITQSPKDIKEIGVQTEKANENENSSDEKQNSLKINATSVGAKAPPPPPPPPPPLPSFSPTTQSGPPPPPPPPPPPMPGAPASSSNNVPLPPPMPFSSSANNPTANQPNGIGISPGLPPPPPPPKPPNSSSTPAPLPNPSECAWFNNKANTLRKAAVNPPCPMKPLYWTRIVTPLPATPAAPAVKPSSSLDNISTSSEENSLDEATKSTSPLPAQPSQIWQEIDETLLDNIDEFTELFSRRAAVPVSKPLEQKDVKSKVIKKVLDSKRSQNVGIFSRSLHVDFSEIENAIYQVDTSVVSLETLQQIKNIQATDAELELIKEAAEEKVPLDYPEKFLLRISQISMSTERISCIVFQSDFEESCTIIARKLGVVTQLSQFLLENEDLKLVFSIILTLGNYMNGGNHQRGQADGFTLEILGKLKDVKSTKNNITLLHFIVKSYIAKRRKDGCALTEISLPTPEPADVEKALQVDFEETKKQINELKIKLTNCKKTLETVIENSDESTLEPFKSKMEDFLESGFKGIDKLTDDLSHCHQMFMNTMLFYQFIPRSCTLEQCTPDQFFECWTSFSNDFKDIWKRELNSLWEQIAKKSRQTTNSNRLTSTAHLNKSQRKVCKLKPGGLKERMLRLSKK